MTKKKESFGSEIYTGTASLGKIMAIISAVMATIAGLIMIPFGIYMIARKSKLTKTALATVSGAPVCSESAEKSVITHTCAFSVTYKVGTKTYTSPLSTSGPISYESGNTINIYYDPTNPSDISENSDNSHVFGIILLVLGIVIPLFAWLWVYITSKSKLAAAAGGASEIMNIMHF